MSMISKWPVLNLGGSVLIAELCPFGGEVEMASMVSGVKQLFMKKAKTQFKTVIFVGTNPLHPSPYDKTTYGMTGRAKKFDAYGAWYFYPDGSRGRYSVWEEMLIFLD